MRRTTALIFVLALSARLWIVLRHGGFHGFYGYDGPVYFAASDALVHGRLPYRDFVLLHPPALVLALTPVAALTRFVSDPTALGLAAVSSAALGAGNAVLVVRVGRAAGLGSRAAATGGVFYALWFGAVGAEYSPRLEPLGNFLLLTALLVALRTRSTTGDSEDLAVGALLGLLLSVKLWWAVPVVAVVLWHGRRARSLRRTGAVLTGLGGAVLACNGPFFLAAPRAMWSAVVLQQLGREHDATTVLDRLGQLSALDVVHPGISHGVLVGAGIVVAVLVAAVAAAASRAAVAAAASRGAVMRPAAVLLALQLVVLLAAPSFFGFYADYLSVPLALCVAGAAAAGTRRAAVAAVAVVTPAALVTLVVLGQGRFAVRPMPAAPALARAVAPLPCVMSDSPMGLIGLDALTRSLAHGCSNWIDVTGRTYGPDRAPTTRLRNERWQRHLRAYLRCGDAVIVVRAKGTGIDTATMGALRRDGVLAHFHGQRVYRVVPTADRPALCRRS